MDGLRRLNTKLRQDRESTNGEQAGPDGNGGTHNSGAVHKEEWKRES